MYVMHLHALYSVSKQQAAPFPVADFIVRKRLLTVKLPMPAISDPPVREKPIAEG